MRVISFTALVVGLCLIPSALGVAKLEHDRRLSELDRTLLAETDEHTGALDNYFERAHSVVLLTANAPAFARVLGEPGSRAQKVRRQSRNLLDVTHQLGYLERLYPSSIGEACFIDADGEELARVVRGQVAPAADLSTTEEQSPFFAPTFALQVGQTYQARPYISPDTNEWVVANATRIPPVRGHAGAIVHFEVTIESFRRAMGRSDRSELRVVDGRTGRVVIDAQHPQRPGAPLGAAADRRFAGLARSAGASGVVEVDGRRSAYRRVRASAGNANDWLLVSSAKRPTGSLLAAIAVQPPPPAGLASRWPCPARAGAPPRAARPGVATPATPAPPTAGAPPRAGGWGRPCRAEPTPPARRTPWHLKENASQLESRV